MRKAQHSARPLKSKRLLYALLLLFICPLLLASLLFNTHQDWFKQHTMHQGHLVIPSVTITPDSIITTSHNTLAPHFFQGKWSLMYLSDHACQQQCTTWLYVLQQIKKATGKHQHHIQNVFLGLSTSLPAERDQHKLSQTTWLTTGLENYQSLYQGDAMHGQIYLIDPRGNMMMRYPLSTKPKAILGDLQRLLKVNKMV